MPLPTGGKIKWPPENLAKTYDRYAELAAWYGGDPDVLSERYGSGGVSDRVDTRYRSSQYRGGLVGAVARMFWGTPPPAGEQRVKLHLPIAGDIASMSADLLFSEPPTMTVEDEATQARLDQLVSDASIHATLLESAEVDSALGDVYLVGTWDTRVAGHPWLRGVHADAVVPEWRGGRLVAATVWTTLESPDKSVVWRHLERHEPGVIYNGLYRGNSTELGVPVDLDERDETKDLADSGPTNIDRLTVIHVPNLRPNRLDRSSPLGRSDFSPGVIQLMDALDETWSSLAREFRLAKARAVVTADIAQPLGRGQGSKVELDREIFIPLRIHPDERPSNPVQLIQPLIRVEEHLAGCRALTDAIIQSTGYSTQSFGSITANVAMTATEVAQRERRSYMTRGMKTLHWGPRVADAMEMLLALDAAVFGTKVTPERPQIEFGDAIAENTATTAQTLSALAQAEAASTETKVRILHPEWDDDAVAEEVARIRVDNGRSVPDPMTVLTAPGDGQDAGN